jgi:hypothetical protein
MLMDKECKLSTPQKTKIFKNIDSMDYTQAEELINKLDNTY